MSTYTDRIENHDIWKTLEEFGPVLDKALSDEELNRDEIDTEGLVRLKAVLEFTGRRLNGADRMLLTVEPLDGIATQLRSAIADVSAFLEDSDTDHVLAANTRADTALGQLAILLVPVTTEDLASLRVAADAYRTALESSLKGVREDSIKAEGEVAALREQLAGLADEVKAEKDRTSSLAAEFQSQFSTRENERATANTEAEREREARFKKLLDEHEESLSESAEALEEDRKKTAADRDEMLKQLDENTRAEALAMLADISKAKAKVDELVGVIGNTGVTEGYRQAADNARRDVKYWQRVTLWAMGGFAVATLATFVPVLLTPSGDIKWGSVVARVFITLAFGAIAGYGATEVSKYQTAERSNRSLALQLAAIGPYVAALDKKDRDEFTLKVGDKAFKGVDSASVDASPSSVLALLRSKDAKELGSALEELIVRVVTATVKATK